MKTPTVIAITAAVLAIMLALKAYRNRGASSTEALPDEVQPTNLLGKDKIKLMPYKEALAASKQFMYNISKAVLERFSPSAKTTLLELGKRLVNVGVQYLHVVDMFTLSLYRQLAHKKAMLQKKNSQDKGRQN